MRMSRLISPRAGAVLAFVVLATAALVTTPAAADEPACRTVSVPVTAGVMSGEFCAASGATRAIQVLVPGITYSHTYWDFPYQPDIYNYRRAANAAGYATLALDRLGTGASSHPLSATVTAFEQADAVHQVIAGLRNGSVTGAPSSSILLGGHSEGSTIAIIEVSTYHDVDAVLLTGFAHHFDAVQLTGLLASMYPATLDPVLRQSYPLPDVGYLTTRPGTRSTYFYPPNPDPSVVAADDATKSVFSMTEAPDSALLGLITPYSLSIKVPVLLVNGDHDAIFCPGGTCTTAATLSAAEAPYYSPAACLHTAVMAGVGHDVNLAPNAPQYHSIVLNWADQVFGGSLACSG